MVLLKVLMKIVVVVVCREIFPLGLPQEFSLICTYRARRTPRGPWDIIRIDDLQDRIQFAVTLNPVTRNVEFSILSYDGTLQTLVFDQAQVWLKTGLNSWYIQPEAT